MVEELALSFDMVHEYPYTFWFFLLLWFDSLDQKQLLLSWSEKLSFFSYVFVHAFVPAQLVSLIALVYLMTSWWFILDRQQKCFIVLFFGQMRSSLCACRPTLSRLLSLQHGN